MRNNKDKVKQYQQQREQHKTHVISKNEWVACKSYFNNCCAYCGLPLEDHIVKYKGRYINSDFHKEHFNHEGENTLNNCIPSCKECNSSKNVKNFYDWYTEDISIYSKERLEKIHSWLNEDYKKYIEEIYKSKRKYIKRNNNQ